VPYGSPRFFFFFRGDKIRIVCDKIVTSWGQGKTNCEEADKIVPLVDKMYSSFKLKVDQNGQQSWELQLFQSIPVGPKQISLIAILYSQSKTNFFHFKHVQYVID
jgi:hypothetical protein